MSAGCDVNIADNKGGQTPLYIAANSGHYPCVKLLVGAGADPSITCQGVQTKQVIRQKFNKVQVEELDLDAITEVSGQATAQKLFDLLDIAEQDGPNDLKEKPLSAMPNYLT